MGRKGRDQMRRHYPAAVYSEQTDENGHTIKTRERKAPVEVSGDHPGMLLKLETSRVFDLAQNVISRYTHEEIDAAYIVYNEFKSVIQQRLVVEKLLPLLKIGIPAPRSLRKQNASALLKPPPAPASLWSQLTPRKPTRKRANSVLRRWTTSTSSQQRSFSTDCSRNIFRPCSIMR